MFKERERGNLNIKLPEQVEGNGTQSISRRIS